MLPKTKRLTTAIFKEVITKGKYFHSPLFVFRFIPNQGESRFGVSVSKKVAPKAVLRNKIRRRFYAVLSNHFSKLKDGLTGVLIVKNEALKADFKHLSKETLDFFGKSGFLK